MHPIAGLKGSLESSPLALFVKDMKGLLVVGGDSKQVNATMQEWSFKEPRA